MHSNPFKSLIVIFLLGIFLIPGFVSLSTYMLLGHTNTEQELMMNAEEEKNEEKSTNKTLTEKEFTTEGSSNLLIAPPFTILTGNLLLSCQHHIKEVFLPINTPPPRA